tara:strand:- start:1724 stop:2743 length:1020 start_codon:yes stop_codon:yes gene_type:complete
MNFLPPEWTPQAAVMLTWPRQDGDFAKHFDQVEACFLNIATQISRFEAVWINCADGSESLLPKLEAAGADTGRIRIHSVASDDVWVRDHGPITVLRDEQPVHLDFQFNAWGGKFEFQNDNLITRKLKLMGALSAPVESVDFVLEGGGIEVDGCGALLTTERCLLAPTRNPQLQRADIEQLLSRKLGVERILWLKHGDLQGDDTDGHIDTLARFCDERTIAYQACSDKNDPHFEDLANMEQELQALRRADGTPYRLFPLPLPSAIHDEDGKRLPAGYANFLIINGAVLVPAYGEAEDTQALDCLRPCFPDREIIGVNCRALILQYGSLHCVSMQIPAAAA